MCGAIRRHEVSIREYNETNHDCAKRRSGALEEYWSSGVGVEGDSGLHGGQVDHPAVLFTPSACSDRWPVHATSRSLTAREAAQLDSLPPNPLCCLLVVQLWLDLSVPWTSNFERTRRSSDSVKENALLVGYGVISPPVPIGILTRRS